MTMKLLKDPEMNLQFYAEWCETGELQGYVARQLRATETEVREALLPVLPRRLGLKPGTHHHFPQKVWTIVKPKHLPALRARLAPLVAKYVATHLLK